MIDLTDGSLCDGLYYRAKLPDGESVFIGPVSYYNLPEIGSTVNVRLNDGMNTYAGYVYRHISVAGKSYHEKGLVLWL